MKISFSLNFFQFHCFPTFISNSIFLPCNRNLSSELDSRSLETPLSLSAGLGGEPAEIIRKKNSLSTTGSLSRVVIYLNYCLSCEKMSTLKGKKKHLVDCKQFAVRKLFDGEFGDNSRIFFSYFSIQINECQYILEGPLCGTCNMYPHHIFNGLHHIFNGLLEKV